MSRMSTMQATQPQSAHHQAHSTQHAQLDVISSFLAMHTATTTNQQMDLKPQHTQLHHAHQHQHHHHHHHHHHTHQQLRQTHETHRNFGVAADGLNATTTEKQTVCWNVEPQHVQQQTERSVYNTASEMPLVATLSTDTVSSSSTTSSSSSTECKSNTVHVPEDEMEGEPVQAAEVEIEFMSDDMDDCCEEFVILLDWDDTLFPTSMINEILQSRNGNDLALVRDDQIEYLNELGRLTLILLNELIDRYGAQNIHIVTNSLDGWIKESLNYAACISKIYKQIELVLIRNNITMQSAQSLYGKRIKNSTPTQWKQYCFDEILKNSHKQYSHILSIGDQWTDHYAVKQSIASLTYYTRKPIHHVIKLKMLPNVNDMINESLYIQACFTQIFNVLSSQKLSFMAAKPIRPVVIDYHNEELKYMQQYYQAQQQQRCNININNVNVNVNLNVNVIKNDSVTPTGPKQFHL